MDTIKINDCKIQNDAKTMDQLPYYNKHIFFCINQRQDNKKCCNNSGAEEFCNYAKTQSKNLKLENIRVNSSGCLGRCAEGPVLVIYPDAIWYSYSNKEDIDEILDSHLQNNSIVERLRLKSKE